MSVPSRTSSVAHGRFLNAGFVLSCVLAFILLVSIGNAGAALGARVVRCKSGSQHAKKACRARKAAVRSGSHGSHGKAKVKSPSGSKTKQQPHKGDKGSGAGSSSGTPTAPGSQPPVAPEQPLLSEGLPEVVPPLEAKSPVEKSPVKTPPVEQPPVEKAPVEKPPTEKPVETPPVEKPPVEKPPVEKPPVEKPHVEPFRFFAPTSIWNTPVNSNVTLDPASAADVGAFESEVAEEIARHELNIDDTAWSVPVYTVPAGQPTVMVLLNKPGSSGNPLQTPWDAVPLPPNAQPAKGTDKHLVVWQPSTDKLWEFWGFENTLSGPEAQWGGAIEHVSTDPGAYDTSAWKQTIHNQSAWEADIRGWGASASSLSIAGGLITLEDFERGKINHALALCVPNPRAGVYASPAQRTDGTSSSSLSLPEGAHLRLDPNLNLATLHLPRVTLMLAEAAQRYGIVVRDRGSNVSFYAQDPTPTGSNPYAGPSGYFEGAAPYALLAAFPWSHLQLLPMELH
jgi:hypothetical protein